jgi:hypothetical protein
MARKTPRVAGAASTKVPGPPPGNRNGPMATGKTQTQSGQGKPGNPKGARPVTRVSAR